jgi:hypothetical protein
LGAPPPVTDEAVTLDESTVRPSTTRSPTWAGLNDKAVIPVPVLFVMVPTAVMVSGALLAVAR